MFLKGDKTCSKVRPPVSLVSIEYTCNSGISPFISLSIEMFINESSRHWTYFLLILIKRLSMSSGCTQEKQKYRNNTEKHSRFFKPQKTWIKLGIYHVNYDSKLFTWRTLAVNGYWLHVQQIIYKLQIKWCTWSYVIIQS